MAKIDLNIPSLGSKFVDIRDTIPGDSYNWSWVRPLNQVNFLAIHHTAGPDTQTPNQIANFHINSNGWGGVGYHFLIDKNGIVYYVGDISTARANVANLNDQVLGICLIGNFTSGRAPTNSQLDSANKLCDFFINNYPNLPNVASWDKVRGHKDLPGQSTACPGDNWVSWRGKLVSGGGGTTPPPTPPPTGGGGTDRGAQVTELYRKVLGRDPDMGGLQTYTNSTLSLDEIRAAMVLSEEHQNLISLGKEAHSLKSQVQSLQSSLALVNDQIINLQQRLQEKDQEITKLRGSNGQPKEPTPTPPPDGGQKDNSLTLLQALYNLYKFVFPPRKVD